MLIVFEALAIVLFICGGYAVASALSPVSVAVEADRRA
jgi:hypothetical protein